MEKDWDTVGRGQRKVEDIRSDKVTRERTMCAEEKHRGMYVIRSLRTQERNWGMFKVWGRFRLWPHRSERRKKIKSQTRWRGEKDHMLFPKWERELKRGQGKKRIGER